MNSESTDILIIGSGPVGATFARVLTERLPQCKVLMLDGGPRLTQQAGMHVMNLSSHQERSRAQRLSEGPVRTKIPSPSEGRIPAQPGTYLLDPSGDTFATSGMPAAAMSTNVGGMGAHWSCACPRPAMEERASFLSNETWDELLSTAERLLRVTPGVFPLDATAIGVLAELRRIFGHETTNDRPVDFMPLASTRAENGERIWSGADTILGELADPETNPTTFELRPQTMCLRLMMNDHGIDYVITKDLSTQRTTKIYARVVIVAADALRTPQLLWGSGLRADALGHYLNDHPQSKCIIQLHEGLASPKSKPLIPTKPDHVLGMYWVPFTMPTHTFSGQVVHLDHLPVSADPGAPKVEGHFAIVTWFCRKDLQYRDCLEFSDTEATLHGMPSVNIQYRLTEIDKTTAATSRELIRRAASGLGRVVDGLDVWTLPSGSSLHYQGTVRMGAADDGTSVCDSHSQVWGTTNLFVAGNGVIPTATACNPTLTSVALAVRACERIVEMLA
ncbi:GMC oxidoreductase [Granulicella sp. S156]|uniref:GMC oxidoreductase n=1 Tax=Granulicella sp. S156 TaxID=1747224 RepID=UPI00131D4C37|nr:GMC oxidoreductase [Granulicella sp. S156]